MGHSVSQFHHVRVMAPVTVLLGVLTVLASASASETALVTVSSTDPYANCSNAGQPGLNYRDSEVEPYVAVNPHLAGNVIGVWQQDRWSNGGAHGLLAGFSTDGGATWSERPLPFSGCV